MDKVKQMPYAEKHELTIDSIQFNETLAMDFVQEHMGSQAKSELQSIYREGLKPVPDGVSIEEKYEAAYKNWVWMGKSNFKFVRERMGLEGIEWLEQAEVEALIRKYAGLKSFLLHLIRAISPGKAFELTAKEFSYQLQWITPINVDRLNDQEMCIDIPRCKILEQPEAQDLCKIGCQRIYPAWAAEQFHVEMKFYPVGQSCICKISPLN